VNEKLEIGKSDVKWDKMGVFTRYGRIGEYWGYIVGLIDYYGGLRDELGIGE